MVDIVIPLGRKSKYKNIELRYCFRSIEKHLSNYRNIYLIGECPKWVQGVIHIPMEDSVRFQHRERNIFHKVWRACQEPSLSETFLFMNDDHYLTTDYFADLFPTYFGGRIGLLPKRYKPSNKYLVTIQNTFAEIGEHAMNFDIHCPINLDKSKFILTFGKINWGKPYGYLLKTLYSFHNQPDYAEYYLDMKFDWEDIKAEDILEVAKIRNWFSIGDKAFSGGLLQALETLYPYKSKYERD